MQGGRKLSAWNLFVKKIYSEGKSNNSNYEFKDALKDASKRKSEMGSNANHVARGTKKVKKSKKSSKRMSKRSMSASAQVAGTRRRRRH
jgi:hypothetical protein